MLEELQQWRERTGFTAYKVLALWPEAIQTLIAMKSARQVGEARQETKHAVDGAWGVRVGDPEAGCDLGRREPGGGPAFPG